MEYESKAKPEVVVQAIYEILALKGEQIMAIAVTLTDPKRYNLMIYKVSQDKAVLVQETGVETIGDVDAVLLAFNESQKVKFSGPTTFTYSRNNLIKTEPVLQLKNAAKSNPLLKATPTVKANPPVLSVKEVDPKPPVLGANQVDQNGKGWSDSGNAKHSQSLSFEQEILKEIGRAHV